MEKEQNNHRKEHRREITISIMEEYSSLNDEEKLTFNTFKGMKFIQKVIEKLLEIL